MRIGIVGGGIGGLAAALACRRAGHDAIVFERAPALGEIGAGLQISPNGSAVLRALGVTVPGRRSRAIRLCDGITGRRVLEMDLSGRAYWLCHRADLIAALAEACRRAAVDLRLGAPVTDAGDGQITSEAGTERVDLIVGADGLHSLLRPRLNGEAAPFFAGQLAWRAIVPGQMADRAEVHMAPGRHVVSYPLRDGQSINLVGIQERADWAEEGWQLPGDPDQFRAAFADFAPDLRDLLLRVDAVRLWGLHRHRVADIWHRGDLALLGDAAHPTLPFLAQGANLALEDAWVLAATLPDLAAYQTHRQARVRRAIAAANANARNYHLSGASKIVAHTALRALDRTAPNVMLRRFDWLYGYDVTRAVPMGA